MLRESIKTKQRINSMEIYLEQCSCKKLPMEFDLCGLRKPRVSPQRGHPMLPSGKFFSSSFPKENFRRRKAKVIAKKSVNAIGESKSILFRITFLSNK